MSAESIQRTSNQNVEYQNHLNEMRRESDKYRKEYKEVVDKNELSIARLESEYKDRIANTENDLEKQLNRVRASAANILKIENDRLQSEVDDLRKAHQERYKELKNSQENQIDNMRKNHASYLESAERKFDKAKSKAES